MKKPIAWLSLLSSPLSLALMSVQAPKAVLLLVLFASGGALDGLGVVGLFSVFGSVLTFLGSLTNMLPQLFLGAFLAIS